MLGAVSRRLAMLTPSGVRHAGTIPRPRLYGHSQDAMFYGVMYALTLPLVPCLAYYYWSYYQKTRIFRDFVNNFDYDADYERMKARGVFRSIPAE